MGTKNNPSAYDCYANAEADEPMFILLGRDRSAPALVDKWADLREANNPDEAELRTIAEARSCAASMRQYLSKLGKSENAETKK